MNFYFISNIKFDRWRFVDQLSDFQTYAFVPSIKFATAFVRIEMNVKWVNHRSTCINSSDETVVHSKTEINCIIWIHEAEKQYCRLAWSSLCNRFCIVQFYFSWTAAMLPHSCYHRQTVSESPQARQHHKLI